MGMLCGGGEIVAGLTWATVRLAARGELDDLRARRVLRVLVDIRWIPSYRTPILVEFILTSVYVALSVGAGAGSGAGAGEETCTASLGAS